MVPTVILEKDHWMDDLQLALDTTQDKKCNVHHNFIVKQNQYSENHLNRMTTVFKLNKFNNNKQLLMIQNITLLHFLVFSSESSSVQSLRHTHKKVKALQLRLKSDNVYEFLATS